MSFSRSDSRSKSCDEHPITYLAKGKQYVAVPIRLAADTRTLETGAPVPFFPTRPATGGNIPTAGFQARAQYGVAPDGRFLMNIADDDAVASPITVVLNGARLGSYEIQSALGAGPSTSPCR